MALSIERAKQALRREVDGGRHGRLTVEITAHGVITRERGTRHHVGPLPWDVIHDMNMKAAAGYRRPSRNGRKHG